MLELRFTIRSLRPGVMLSRRRIAWELGYLMENYPNFIWFVHHSGWDHIVFKTNIPQSHTWKKERNI